LLDKSSFEHGVTNWSNKEKYMFEDFSKQSKPEAENGQVTESETSPMMEEILAAVLPPASFKRSSQRHDDETSGPAATGEGRAERPSSDDNGNIIEKPARQKLREILDRENFLEAVEKENKRQQSDELLNFLKDTLKAISDSPVTIPQNVERLLRSLPKQITESGLYAPAPGQSRPTENGQSGEMVPAAEKLLHLQEAAPSKDASGTRDSSSPTKAEKELRLLDEIGKALRDIESESNPKKREEHLRYLMAAIRQAILDLDQGPSDH
jgi:hypothetical protein